jgi:hypothetical protein
MVHRYKKLLRKEGKELSAMSNKTKNVYEELEDKSSEPSTSATRDTDRKLGKFHKQQKQFKQKLLEEEKDTEQYLKAQKEKEEALEKYKKKKKKNHKMLLKKNFRGQPNLSSQMELLLEKIQKSS